MAASPDPEGFSLLGKVVGAAVAIGAPLFGGWKWINGALETKADKSEMDRQRDNISKLFDKFDEHQKSDSENFAKVMEKMSEIHVDLIERLRK